jgi:hypothetical protein
MLPLLGGKPFNFKQPYNPVHRQSEKNPYDERIRLPAVDTGFARGSAPAWVPSKKAIPFISPLVEMAYGNRFLAADPSFCP